jgi:hypothetical protein
MTLEETARRIDDILFLKGVLFSFRNLQQTPKILIEKFRLIRERFAHIGDCCELP